jgi:hypothetical protein
MLSLKLEMLTSLFLAPETLVLSGQMSRITEPESV